tara:strand:- start:96 stop:1214 length:1119 start_codon:yes stop_codon:yes gene_type:complete
MSRCRDFADLAAAYKGDAQLSHRNLIHNGDMTISQRGTSATGVGASNGFPLLDRWNWSQSSNGRVTMTQEAVTDLSGFFHCLKVATTTADTSIAAGEYVILSQGIESRGGLTQRMKKGYSDAEKLTLSFWAKANASATYGLSLRDNDNDRMVNATFTVGTSWEKQTITFPGDSSTGDKPGVDHNATITVYIWLHAGSTYNGGTFSNLTWADTTWNTAVNSSNTSLYDATSRTFFITGVQLEVGEVATPFEHKSFEDNLAQCQRFFLKVGPNPTSGYTRFQTGHCINSTSQQGVMHFPVSMRAAGTLTSLAAANYCIYHQATVTACTSISLSQGSNDTLSVYNQVSSGLTAGEGCSLLGNNNDTAYIAVSAEI